MMLLRLMLTFLLITFASSPASAEAGARSPEIRQLLKDYETGFRGDRRALERTFAPGAYFVTVNEKTEAIGAPRVTELIPQWMARADPNSRIEVIGVHMTNENMAVANLRLYWNGGVYHDHLNLQRLAAGWKIVAKLCVEQRPRA